MAKIGDFCTFKPLKHRGFGDISPQLATLIRNFSHFPMQPLYVSVCIIEYGIQQIQNEDGKAETEETPTLGR